MGIWRKTESRPATGPVTPGLFALRGRDRRALAATLERLALLGPRLSGPERQQLAADWCRQAAARPSPRAAAPSSAADGSPSGTSPSGTSASGSSSVAEDGEIRVAFLAESNDQLVTRARLAADLVSKVRPGPVLSEAGVYLSYAARGRTVLIFPGGDGVPAAEAAAVAASVRTLRWLDRCRVTAAAGVGAGLGEIAGLVWAGSLTASEAARLITQHGELRGGAGLARTGLARIPACYRTTTKLAVSCGLFVACYEGPHSHVLGGPATAVRELARQADSLGLPAEVLAADHALHTPVMAPSVAPLRSVLSQVRFGPPRRRLASTVTGRVLTGQEDIAALLCAQLTTPVRFREALAVVADGADLLMLAAPDEALAAAAACSGLPVTSVPASGQDPGACTAALFAAGALPDLAAPAQPAGHGTVAQIAAGAAAGTAQAAATGAGPAVTRAAAQMAAPPAAHTTGPATGPSAAVIPLVRPGTAGSGVPGVASARGRFVEKITMLRAGEELRAEVRLSPQTDPYLTDYLVDGQPVFPAAMALEAMAQAASTLTQQPMRGARQVVLGDLVRVAADGETLLRVRARVRDDGVETFLHSGSGLQFAECARAVFVGAPESREVAEPGAGAAPPGDDAAACGPASLVDGVDLYNTVCFQTGRFRRVAIVSGRPPRSCRAIVRGHDDAPWFEQLPDAAAEALVLGSPGLNDAALQVAQACVPGRVLRPGGCDSLAMTGAQVQGAVELRVYLISGPPSRPAAGDGGTEPTDYVWDIHGYDGTGQLMVAWTGLRMRDAGPLPSRRGRSAARDQEPRSGPLTTMPAAPPAPSADPLRRLA
jgi:acyl transferase family protein/polyketide synthase family protein/polyketide synthase-like dehydratase family protein